MEANSGWIWNSCNIPIACANVKARVSFYETMWIWSYCRPDKRIKWILTSRTNRNQATSQVIGIQIIENSKKGDLRYKCLENPQHMDKWKSQEGSTCMESNMDRILIGGIWKNKVSANDSDYSNTISGMPHWCKSIYVVPWHSLFYCNSVEDERRR